MKGPRTFEQYERRLRDQANLDTADRFDGIDHDASMELFDDVRSGHTFQRTLAEGKRP